MAKSYAFPPFYQPPDGEKLLVSMPLGKCVRDVPGSCYGRKARNRQDDEIKSAAGSKTNARKKGSATSRARRLSIVASNPVNTGEFAVAVTVCLKCCDRRKQNLPDNAFADWIVAESEMSLVN
jgi:hypothetical protein